MQSNSILLFLIFTLGHIISAGGQAPVLPPLLHPPVKHPLRLSGTFGELRSNHFHAGLDIKSEKGTWGDPIFAIDDGYIARITVSHSGYGRALFINHSSGHTSVYGHLQSFTPEVDAYILENQRKEESFSIDLTLLPTQFQIVKGQLIGKMGSTGFSFGPHLHFEIRNTASQKIINPQLFNFNITDHEKPIINSFVIYKLDYQLFEYGKETCNRNKSGSIDTITLDAWRIGIGLETYDPHNAGGNKNGIYTASVKIDGENFYQFTMDSISLEDRSFYDVHIDYAAQVSLSKKIHRCYRLPSNRLSIIDPQLSDGILPLFKDRIQKVTLLVTDFRGNRDSLDFYVNRATQVSSPEYPAFQHHLIAGKKDTIRSAYIEVIWPTTALYQDLYCQFTSEPPNGPDVYSAKYKVHHEGIPLRDALTLKIRPFPVADSLKSKLVIARITQEGKMRNCLSSWTGSWLSCPINQLGTYQVVADTQPPTIKVIKNSPTPNGHSLVFEINDDLPPAGGLTYRASLDGQWVLAEYDLKSKKITCHLSKLNGLKKPLPFKLLVKDSVGNATTYEYPIHFK